MKPNYLIIGGTGKTGRKVVQFLEKRGKNVRIGSRQQTPSFDWQKPENWGELLDGIDKMYVTFQPDLAVPGSKEAISALTEIAKEKGVKKMVLLSGKGETEAEVCEQIVKESGLDFVIIRASWFNQNFSESFFVEPIKAGMVALPKVDAKVPYVDTDDLAEVAIEALLNDHLDGKMCEITGPEVLTFGEVISIIAKETGRDIQLMEVTLEEYDKMLEQAGVPRDYRWLINYLFSEVLGTPGNNVVTHDIEEILGRKAKSFEEYVRETAKTGVWAAIE